MPTNPTEESILATGVLAMPVKSVRSALHCGFRQDWITAEDKDAGTVATLQSGAGLGSPYLILTIERPDQPTIYETVHMGDVLGDWITQAIGRAERLEGQDG